MPQTYIVYPYVNANVCASNVMWFKQKFHCKKMDLSETPCLNR